MTSPRRPTMADVARHADVSLKTVSRVVNGVATVDPVLAERVRVSSDALGFRPNQVAASLRSGRATSTIALLIKDLSNDFYSSIAAAAAVVASRNGTQLITAHSGENASDELEVAFDLCARRVDGLLIVPTGGDQAALRTEIDRGIPMVFVDRPAHGLQADSVLIDNTGGARRGVQRLIEKGHRRIGVIVDTLRNDTMAARLQGARLAFADAGLPFDPALVETGVGDPETAATTAARMLDTAHPPTAFFCGNNRSAIGVLEFLWDSRRNEDLLGFDDFALSRLMPRPLSCITYDNRALGTIAADLLFRRIARESFPPQRIVLPTTIVDRGRAD